MTTQDDFAEDILGLITDKPRLLNDIIASLRGGMYGIHKVESGRRWKNVNESEVERLAASFGAYFGSRKHGAGIAIYVASVSFETVTDRFGKAVPVQSFRRTAGY